MRKSKRPIDGVSGDRPNENDKLILCEMRWANVHAVDVKFDVKFSQDLTHQKSLKSVNF